MGIIDKRQSIMKTMNTPIFSPPITVEDIMSMKHEEEPPALISADRVPQFSPCIQLCGGNDYDHHTAADIDESEYNEQRNIDMAINLLRQQQQKRQVKQRPVSPSKSNCSQEEGSSILDSISSFIESVQVCGLYICGFGRAAQEDDDIQKDAKDERKDAIDDTFMGKVISCPANGCGRTSQSVVADEIDVSDNIRIAYIRSSTSIHSELSEL